MTKRDWYDGFKKIIYVMLSYIPLGLACGIALDKAGYSAISIAIMSFLIFAGAGQFMIAQLTFIGASPLSIISTIFFLNIRHFLMSSGLIQHLKEKSTGFYLIYAHTIVDETFGVNITQFTTNRNWTPNKALSVNVLAHISWIISSFCGALVGQRIDIPLTIVNYVLIAMFIAMLVEQVLSRIHLIAALTAGVAAIVLKLIMKNNISLVLAAILASTLGFLISNKSAKFNDDEKRTINGQ